MKTLFVEWYDSAKNKWVTVGKLTESNSKYTFKYSHEALHCDAFTPFGLMSNLNATYESDELFPFFLNRILNRSRPEFGRFLSWLDLGLSASPMEVLSLSQGTRETDAIRVYSLPAIHNSYYSMKFFVAGMSHVEQSDVRLASLKVGEKLFLMDDVQNTYSNALTLRTSEPKYLLGYCPSFASTFIKAAVCEAPHDVNITVAKVNLDAPSPYALLCDAIIPASKYTTSIIDSMDF